MDYRKHQFKLFRRFPVCLRNGLEDRIPEVSIEPEIFIL